MEIIEFNVRKSKMIFGIDENGILLLLKITTKERAAYSKNRSKVPIEVKITGENTDDHHGAKYTGCNAADPLLYVSHKVNGKTVCFILKNSAILVNLYYIGFASSDVIASYAEIKNISNDDIGLEYVSSFCLYDFEVERLYVAHNSWCKEYNWRSYSLEDVGLLRGKFSTKRFNVSNFGTWSSKEFLPIGYISTLEGGIMWQIESNNSWNYEIGDISDNLYLKLSGASEQDCSWWKKLSPNEVFKTDLAAVCVTHGNINNAIEEFTKYRREISYKNNADEYLPVIFNDYMNCINADPTTEKELPVIEAAAEMGAEIYCMDAGWYADGTWWETVGEWKVFEKRFPNGIEEIFAKIKDCGMKSGIWLEPESIGVRCPIINRFDDDCFFMRHGKRVIDHGRYQFDFRCKKVTDYLDSIVDGLIEKFGITYFKFDYNIESGIGTELDADSFGDGLKKHAEAYLNWIDGIYSRHKNIIIESCASGGMRMDWKSLQHFSLQSLTDANSYETISKIAANSSTNVLPEQAAVWCIPMRKHTDKELRMSMTCPMLKRMHLSGELHLLTKEQKMIIQKGVEEYKKIRNEIKTLIPFYPFGLNSYDNSLICVGYKNESNAYLIIVNLSDESTSFEISLDKEYRIIKTMFALFDEEKIMFDSNKLLVNIVGKSSNVITMIK